MPRRRVLAFLMEQQGVSQYQLAKEGIVDQGNLSKILKGEREISKEFAKKSSMQHTAPPHVKTNG